MLSPYRDYYNATVDNKLCMICPFDQSSYNGSVCAVLEKRCVVGDDAEETNFM